MNESYGNVGWQIFVYASYFIVGVSLLSYVIMAIFSRKKSLKNMYEEGFFQEKNSKNSSAGEKSL
ncbi:hypothetical protein [Fluviispira multicolorata]|uniref:Heme exporter protein D n=1 Tax=Fluviispira multicolorata TaxID=2654512 RepID=A0A833JCA7_9BACT|nr:hypothetical protein [Fluviispira multicolorata]KAB8030626.1 hypothetical protein GCL57_06530 [Fluviispira multicolorata]